MNLAALHGQLGESERQLALVESLLDDGRLTQPAHLKMIANLYLGEELPYKAATLMEAELASGRIESTVSNLELLSQAWYMSAETERSIKPRVANSISVWPGCTWTPTSGQLQKRPPKPRWKKAGCVRRATPGYCAAWLRCVSSSSRMLSSASAKLSASTIPAGRLNNG
ncbi:MAG: hypothetical protein ACI87W_002572 [Halieaceae bacterium]|jgi:hypothetical protein